MIDIVIIHNDGGRADELELLGLFICFHFHNLDIGSDPLSVNASAQTLKRFVMRGTILRIEKTNLQTISSQVLVTTEALHLHQDLCFPFDIPKVAAILLASARLAECKGFRRPLSLTVDKVMTRLEVERHVSGRISSVFVLSSGLLRLSS